jgi:hypothetical protein
MGLDRTEKTVSEACDNASRVCYNFSAPVRPETLPDFDSLSAERTAVFRRGAMVTILALTHSLPPDMTIGELQESIEGKVHHNKT